MPLQVGAIDGTGNSAKHAGLFDFVEIGAFAASMLVIGLRIDGLPIRKVATQSALLAAGANVGLLLVTVFN